MSARSAVAVVLQVKELRERTARIALAAAQREHLEAERRATDARDRLAARSWPEHGTHAQFVGEASTRTRLGAEVVALRAAAAARVDDVGLSLRTWQATDQERDAASRLVERDRSAARDDAERLERRTTDDIALARHGRTRTPAEETRS